MAEQTIAAQATARTVRMSARKVRLVLDLIRNKTIGEAIAILKNSPQEAARVSLKVLNSAIANAENNYDLDVTRLYVSEAYANEGPTLKRFRPRAKGAASRIHKRTSHITIAVKEVEGE